MSEKRDFDIAVVGGGISGSFAGATAASKGVDVVQIERKPREQAGHIACGDAIKDPTNDRYYPGPIDMEAIAEDEDVLIDDNIDQIEWWDEELEVKKVLEYSGSGSQVVDRYELGQNLLEQASEEGVEQHFDTVVNGVLQDDQVHGVEAIRDGVPVTYEADLVIDAGGSLSTIMAETDFESLDADAESFIEQPHFDQFGSAYREVINTQEPVEYSNALVGKPLEETGYIWYFPRTDTEINAGLGFQMSEDPMNMIDVLADDLSGRPEFEEAEVDRIFEERNQLGAALSLRRPLDSMVAPGYITVGCNAGVTHPISGKGIRGAAVTGYSAGKHGAEAILNDEDGFISEKDLWDHNHFIYVEHGLGTRIASKDPYNIAATNTGMENVRALVAMLPEEEISNVVSANTEEGLGYQNISNMLNEGLENAWHHYRSGSFEKLDTTKREVLGTMRDFLWTAKYASELQEHYQDYPESREGFEEWLDERNEIDDKLNSRLGIEGSERKYA